MKWEIFIALFAVTSSIAHTVPGTSETGIKPLSPKEIEKFSKFLEKTSVVDNGEKEVAVPADDNAWLNSGKFEGDIILDAIQRQKIVAKVGSTGRAVVTDLALMWPDKTIPYRIKTSDYDESQVKAIKDVLNLISAETCLTFKDMSRKKVRDVIVIGGKNRGCFSEIGRRGGKQVLNLDKTHLVGTGCFRVGAIAHELFHSLGFLHTQSRMDRDEYVKIYMNNVKEGKEHNFLKYVDRPKLGGGKDILAYDYNSIMHYPRKAFTNNGEDTIVPLKSNTPIGQRKDIYLGDLININVVYCNDTTTPLPGPSGKRPKKDK